MPCRHGRASEGALSLSVVTGPLEMLMKLLHCFLGSTQRHMAVWATLEIMDRSGASSSRSWGGCLEQMAEVKEGDDVIGKSLSGALFGKA